MAQRQQLQTLLEGFLDAPDAADRVYFQPTTNVQMQYPCFIYKLDDIHTDHGDNIPYRRKMRYQITHVTRDPDDLTHLKVGALPSAAFDRSFPVDGLYHHVYSLHF